MKPLPSMTPLSPALRTAIGQTLTAHRYMREADREIVLLAVMGLTLKEIADARGTTYTTVKKQSQEIMRVRHAVSLVDLARFVLVETAERLAMRPDLTQRSPFG